MINLNALLRKSLWMREKAFRVDEADTYLVDKIGTLLLPMRREELLRYLPSRARVAEIGVARGKFSSQIKSITKPSVLSLIDPWLEQDPETYRADGNNVAQQKQDQRYNSVRKKFQSARTGHECRIIRKFSADAVQDFADKSLDWIYIDGNHSYEACLEDLRLWAPKVTDDGFICGHDFAHQQDIRKIFGVVEAVGQFVKETNFLLAAMTVEHFPTFVIAKNPSGHAFKTFRHLMFSYQPHLIQVHNIFDAEFDQARILNNGIARSSIVSFDFSK